MRILFTFAGGHGHLNPLLPLAHAAAVAGQTVAFCGRPWMIPVVEATGFDAFAAGTDVGGAPMFVPLKRLDPEAEVRKVGKGFAGRVARERAADLLPVCAEWHPNLIVWEELDFGAAVVAERIGVPHASVLCLAAGSFVRPAIAAAPLNRLRAAFGLPPDPALAMLSRHLVLSPFPPSLRDPAFPLPATGRLFRAADVQSTTEAPPWLTQRTGAPLVYFTLGTIFNTESGDLFVRVLAGLRELAVNIVVTVGSARDPAELGPQPANVHIERYIPQATLVPHCDLIISHGGSGSVLGALAHGLPMVLLPIGADQHFTAARCAALGVGQVLDALDATPDKVRETVSAVLMDRRYRQAAERLQDEIAAMPESATAVRELERLAERHAS